MSASRQLLQFLLQNAGQEREVFTWDLLLLWLCVLVGFPHAQFPHLENAEIHADIGHFYFLKLPWLNSPCAVIDFLISQIQSQAIYPNNLSQYFFSTCNSLNPSTVGQTFSAILNFKPSLWLYRRLEILSLIDSTWSIRCLQQISCKSQNLGSVWLLIPGYCKVWNKDQYFIFPHPLK